MNFNTGVDDVWLIHLYANNAEKNILKIRRIVLFVANNVIQIIKGHKRYRIIVIIVVMSFLLAKVDI